MSFALLVEQKFPSLLEKPSSDRWSWYNVSNKSTSRAQRERQIPCQLVRIPFRRPREPSRDGPAQPTLPPELSLTLPLASVQAQDSQDGRPDSCPRHRQGRHRNLGRRHWQALEFEGASGRQRRLDEGSHAWCAEQGRS